MSKAFVCPKPDTWNRIYEDLLKVWEEPLTLLAHWADYWTAHIFEEGRRPIDETDYYRKD